MVRPVSRLELLALLDDAHRTKPGLPGIGLMRDRALDVLGRAVVDRGLVDVEELDAIVAAARETGEHRARYHLGDPYLEKRARCIDVLTRLRTELEDQSGRSREQAGMSLPGRAAALGMRIRAVRREAGLTQVQLAQKLEVNQTTVARWEAGGLAPNHRHRWRLADLLGGRPADYEE
ncbi:MAG: helix-turn-helix domain-containing protein [Acidimicrobiaceae bacterium]|nr:helix-turn-helix domain-containing protein [Acidimicrobiaceae bacterium]